MAVDFCSGPRVASYILQSHQQWSTFDPLEEVRQLTAVRLHCCWVDTDFVLYKLSMFLRLNFSRSHARVTANGVQCLAVNGFPSCSCEVVFSRKEKLHRLGTHQDYATQQIQGSGSTTKHGLIRAWLINRTSVCCYQFCCSVCRVAVTCCVSHPTLDVEGLLCYWPVFFYLCIFCCCWGSRVFTYFYLLIFLFWGFVAQSAGLFLLCWAQTDRDRCLFTSVLPIF